MVKLAKRFKRWRMGEKKFDEWFGVPRKEIPWYPKIDPAVCIGCGLCAVICGRDIYSHDPVSPWL